MLFYSAFNGRQKFGERQRLRPCVYVCVYVCGNSNEIGDGRLGLV